MTYHSQVAPLPAGERIGGFQIGGLLHATPMTLRYTLPSGGQLVEFAPDGFVARGAEGLLEAQGSTRALTLKDAAQTFIAAELAATHGDAAPGEPLIELNGTLYYHAALPEGRFLSSQLNAAKAWNAERLRTVLLEVSDRLSTGVPHGALAARHVFLVADESVRLTGFGEAAAAQVLGQTLDPSNALGGERGDLYALSELGYQLLTGQAAPSFAQRKAAMDGGRKDPLVPPGEYVSAQEHRALIQALERGLSLDGQAVSIADWAFTVGGRTRITPSAAKDKATAQDLPVPAAPAPTVPAPAPPPRPMRPMRPARGKAEPKAQGTPLATIAAFLLGLGVLTGVALYVSQSGMFERGDEETVSTPDAAKEEVVPIGPGPAEERAWVNARTIDTVASYTAYLERYPQGNFIDEAQQRLNALDDAAWQSALEANTLEAYRGYLEDFPLGLHVPEAQQLIDRLEAGIAAIAAADKAAFEDARKRDTVAAYDGYLAAYPDGAFVDEAKERRRAALEISRDEEAYAAAKRLGTRKAYQSYVDRFPKGQYVAEALTMLDKLTSRVGDVMQDCKACPQVVILPKGSFDMGAAPGDRFAKPNENPRRKVTFAKSFALGQSEVTVGQWKACVASGACQYDPKQGTNDAAPVVQVSWQDARDYAAWLAKTTGKPYRLPTESEWEYAARAGDEAIYAAGREGSVCKLGNIAGAETNVPWRTQSCDDGVANGVEPVQRRLPNAFGLYDMIGNAAEWVQDCNSLDYRDAPTDGKPNERGMCGSRIARGGSWISGPRDFRLSARTGRIREDTDDTTGFRVALTLPQ